MKKKGNMQTIIGTILLFSVVMFVFLFSTIGLKQIFSENIIAPVLTELSPQVSTATQTTINDYSLTYALEWFDYDLFFLIFVLVAFSGTVLSAYKEKKLGWMSFFGYITVGSYVFLLALTFVTTISDWLILNFYQNLFNLMVIDTPIIDFFIEEIHIISFIWFIIIIFVNQFDLGGFVKRNTDEGIVEE